MTFNKTKHNVRKAPLQLRKFRLFYKTSMKQTIRHANEIKHTENSDKEPIADAMKYKLFKRKMRQKTHWYVASQIRDTRIRVNIRDGEPISCVSRSDMHMIFK